MHGEHDDALAADASFLARIEELSPDERAAITLSLGPMQFDFDGFVGLRLNEHVLHTWDVEIALDPAATLPAEHVEAVVDNLGLITRFGAKPTGAERTVTVQTTAPERTFTVAITADAARSRPSGKTARISSESHTSCDAMSRSAACRHDVSLSMRPSLPHRAQMSVGVAENAQKARCP